MFGRRPASYPPRIDESSSSGGSRIVMNMVASRSDSTSDLDAEISKLHRQAQDVLHHIQLYKLKRHRLQHFQSTVDLLHQLYRAFLDCQWEMLQEEGQALDLDLDSANSANLANIAESPMENKDQTPVESILPTHWSGFYNKTIKERQDLIELMYPHIFQPSGQSIEQRTALPVHRANHMIENCIGVFSLPLGLGLNFKIDGQKYVLPMVVEEPSVIAAASSAAKLIGQTPLGFQTHATGNIMTGQIQLCDVPPTQMSQRESICATHEPAWIDYANQNLCSNMKKRGGGLVSIVCRRTSDHASSQIILHLHVDVCDCMGANVVNTVCEGLSDAIAKVYEARKGLCILTNLCTFRRAVATFELPFSLLSWKNSNGRDVAEKIVEACAFAQADPYRACTNNKGIMNGIDALAIATGQDWRALEAGAHGFANSKSLTTYEITDKSSLKGRIELPLAVGTKGGALASHPGYAFSHALLGHPNARRLAQILASVGLGQNFAALRALAITGIQHGHMGLHARNVALASGAPSELVPQLQAYMITRGKIDLTTAMEYVKAHDIYSALANNNNHSPMSNVRETSTTPSMFYVAISAQHAPGAEFLPKVIPLNVAFETSAPHSIILIRPHVQSSESITVALLGDKGLCELERMFVVLEDIKDIWATARREFPDILSSARSKETAQVQDMLQLISILINVLLYRMVHHPNPSADFDWIWHQLRDIHSIDETKARIGAYMDSTSNPVFQKEIFQIGLPLLLALVQVFRYHVDQQVRCDRLKSVLWAEQQCLIRSIVEESLLSSNTEEAGCDEDVERQVLHFMSVHSKRWQVTMFLLIDVLAIENDDQDSRLTDAMLDQIQCIGRYMEYQGILAHDRSRLERAQQAQELSQRETNVFVFYSQCLKVQNSASSVNLEACLEHRLEELWRHCQDQLNTEEACRVYFSIQKIVHAVERIQHHYREQNAD